MKALGLQDLPISAISVGDRLRSVSEAHARMLADSIAEGGLRSPIEVRKAGKGYGLIAGAHRLAAVKMLGWETVSAFTYQATVDEARLMEVDENLVRHELAPLDRAMFLAERQALYLKLHPEAGHGGDRRSEKARDQVAIVATRSFAEDVREQVGLSDRAVRRALFIASKLVPEVRIAITGTVWATKQSDLLTLAKAEPDTQRAALQRLKAGDAASVSAALRLASGIREVTPSPTDAAFDRLVAAWTRAPGSARRQFIEHLQETGALDEVDGIEKEAA